MSNSNDQIACNYDHVHLQYIVPMAIFQLRLLQTRQSQLVLLQQEAEARLEEERERVNEGIKELAFL